MELKLMLESLALEFMAQNTIVEHGEIVETIWGDWKKPHNVKICKIKSSLPVSSWDIVDCERRYKLTKPEFVMEYVAQRLRADGTVKDGENSGIYLSNLKKLDGTIWQITHETINHCAYSWELPKSYNQRLNSDGAKNRAAG